MRIICENTGAEFNGTEAEARAAGWRYGWDGWESPAPGWQRHPERPTASPISRDFVAYEGGIDFDPVPLNFGGA